MKAAVKIINESFDSSFAANSGGSSSYSAFGGSSNHLVSKFEGKYRVHPCSAEEEVKFLNHIVRFVVDVAGSR